MFNAQLLKSLSFPLGTPDAVSNVLSVLGVLRMLQGPLYHRRERQTHPRHGVSQLLRTRHQRPREAGQLLLHAGYTGELRGNVLETLT